MDNLLQNRPIKYKIDWIEFSRKDLAKWMMELIKKGDEKGFNALWEQIENAVKQSVISEVEDYLRIKKFAITEKREVSVETLEKEEE